MIFDTEPFNVRYDDNKKWWMVYSTWPDNPNLVGPGSVGVFIRKSDGKVMEFVFSS